MSRYLPVEIIRADESYTIEEFRRRTGIGDYSWRKIRRLVPIRRIGKKLYVLGADWLAFLSTVEPDDVQENGASNGRHAVEIRTD